MQVNMAEKRPRNGGQDHAQLTASAADLERLAAGLFTLTERCPARLTLRQALAFSMIAYAHAMGRAITLATILELTDGAIGQSIRKTIQVFFEPSKDFPDALRWVERLPDPTDHKANLLVLTKLGEEVAADIVEQLREPTLNS